MLLVLLILATELDYLNELEKCKHLIDNFDKEGLYKNLTLRENGNLKKFADLKLLEKDVFYYLQGEILTKRLAELEQKWQKEPIDTIPKEKIEVFLKELKNLRIKMAKKYQSYVENMFKTHADTFTKEEKDQILNKIIEFNKKIK